MSEVQASVSHVGKHSLGKSSFPGVAETWRDKKKLWMQEARKCLQTDRKSYEGEPCPNTQRRAAKCKGAGGIGQT